MHIVNNFISEQNQSKSYIGKFHKRKEEVFNFGNPMQQVSGYQGTHTNLYPIWHGSSESLCNASGMKSLVHFTLENYEISRPYCVYLHLTTEREKKQHCPIKYSANTRKHVFLFTRRENTELD